MQQMKLFWKVLNFKKKMKRNVNFVLKKCDFWGKYFYRKTLPPHFEGNHNNKHVIKSRTMIVRPSFSGKSCVTRNELKNKINRDLFIINRSSEQLEEFDTI